MEAQLSSTEVRVSDAGIPARWVWAGTGEIPPGEVVIEMVSKRSWPVPGGLFAEYSKTLQMRRRELDRYLIELAEQKTWIEDVRFMLADPDAPQRPWPCYRTNTPSGCRTSELGNYPGSRAGMIPSWGIS